MQNSVISVNKDIHHRAETKTNLQADESKKIATNCYHATNNAAMGGHSAAIW